MYEIVNLSKTFLSDKSEVVALKDVNLTITKNDIFGIIGASGAGKSTLIRCLNALEIPDDGQVIFKDTNILDLSKKEIRQVRKKIGFIFQHFNLLNSKTVYDNIAFPLKGRNKQEIENRVNELLELVGLSDKKESYPTQLSGGQKQRVAIARALANNPDVLLCDEATSALDPKTTQSILNLLKDLNKKLNLTIVLITHEMSVIKSICNKVAIMEHGEVKEVNDVVSLFTNPKSDVAKDLIKDTYNLQNVQAFISEDTSLKGKTYELVYGASSSDKAIITMLIKDFDLEVNILSGNVEIVSDQSIGRLVVSLNGSEANLKDSFKFLKAEGVGVYEFI